MKCQAALVLVLATAAYFTAAYECPAPISGTKVFEADLNTGLSFIHSRSRISWVKTLTSSVSGACSRQGVIKITFPDPKLGQQRCRFKFDLQFSSPLGWNFNIGDSSNTGDSYDISNAEVFNTGDSFNVYSNLLDGYESYGSPGTLVEKKARVVNGHVSVTVGDEFIKYESSDWNKCYASRYLFTLNGQASNYGPVNYDIFFSMNRVIYPYPRVPRTGTGLCKATITAMDCDLTSGGSTDVGATTTTPSTSDPGINGPHFAGLQ